MKAGAGTVTAADAVCGAVRTFEREDVSRLISELGTNVAVASDCAVEPADMVAVTGRTHRVGDVRTTGGVQQGAWSNSSRFLLGVRREGGREVTAACNVGADDEVVDVVRDR